jgi:hypothetical protein
VSSAHAVEDAGATALDEGESSRRGRIHRALDPPASHLAQHVRRAAPACCLFFLDSQRGRMPVVSIHLEGGLNHMNLYRAALVLACMLGLGSGGPALAQPCVQDADCENGDTCSLPDLCVSNSCAPGGGDDSNDDLVCDAELDTTLTFELSKVVLRRRTTGLVDNSSLKGRGDLLRSVGTGPLIGVDGLAIRVKDALSAIPPSGDGADVSFAWAGTDCSTKINGLTKCKSGDGLSSAIFKPSPTSPNQFQFSSGSRASRTCPGRSSGRSGWF